MNYSPHGRYNIKQEDNILLVQAQGPFNDVIAQQYHQEMAEYVTKMRNSTWGTIINYRGNGLFTPEAEQNLMETTRFRMNNGMVAVAGVIIATDYADMLQMQLQRIYQSCHIQFNFFSDVDLAKKWLNSFLAEQKQSTKPKNHDLISS